MDYSRINIMQNALINGSTWIADDMVGNKQSLIEPSQMLDADANKD